MPAAATQQVKDALATEQAYHGIRELILLQKLRAGERTSVASLSERLHLGRTPIKEAITRLSTEGLVKVHDRRGTFVHEPSVKDIRDMFSVRRLLEGYAASEAVEHSTDQDLKELATILEELEVESLRKAPSMRSMSRFLEMDVHFHRVIVGCAKNDALSRLYAGLNVDLQIAIYLQRHGPSMAEARHQEHVQMMAALRAGDGELLRSSLLAHAEAVEHVVLASMADL